MTRLVSFGCSWTFGVGLAWEPGFTQEDYQLLKKDIPIADKYSFRGILAREFGLEHKNFSVGGSSNQRQFRHSEEFQFKEGDIVLWGITSTARNEIWWDHKNYYKGYFYNHATTCKEYPEITKGDKSIDGDLCRMIKMTAKRWYSHKEEVRRLFYKIRLYNDYFKCKGVKILWYDTLNHHNYQEVPENMLYGNEEYRDLLSRLARLNGFNKLDDKYHFSWSKGFNDCGRIDFISKNGIANPFSGHPTKEGHRQLADMIRPFVKECIE